MLRLSCVVHGPIYDRFMGFRIKTHKTINRPKRLLNFLTLRLGAYSEAGRTIFSKRSKFFFFFLQQNNKWQ